MTAADFIAALEAVLDVAETVDDLTDDEHAAIALLRRCVPEATADAWPQWCADVRAVTAARNQNQGVLL